MTSSVVLLHKLKSLPTYCRRGQKSECQKLLLTSAAAEVRSQKLTQCEMFLSRKLIFLKNIFKVPHLLDRASIRAWKANLQYACMKARYLQVVIMMIPWHWVILPRCYPKWSGSYYEPSNMIVFRAGPVILGLWRRPALKVFRAVGVYFILLLRRRKCCATPPPQLFTVVQFSHWIVQFSHWIVQFSHWIVQFSQLDE